MFPPGVDLSAFPDQEQETNFSGRVPPTKTGNYPVVSQNRDWNLGHAQERDFDLIVKMAPCELLVLGLCWTI